MKTVAFLILLPLLGSVLPQGLIGSFLRERVSSLRERVAGSSLRERVTGSSLRERVTGSTLEAILKGGPQVYLNSLPQVPDWLLAGPVRRPVSGVCSCLGNLGGCYIDAQRPPGPSFTCKCVKADGWVSGRTYGCVGIGYKLAWGEEETGGGYDREQCLNGAKEGYFDGDCGGYYEYFSDSAWDKVRKDVNIRLYTPNSLRSTDECSMWEQGRDIQCRLRGMESDIDLPQGFNPNLPVKIMIPGFADDVRLRTDAVPRYMEKFRGEVNVILVNWIPLGRPLNLEEDSLDNSLYYRGARNALIVGEYLGRCLAGISADTGLLGSDIHVAGHSLGAQMLGTLGRSYEWWMGSMVGFEEKIGRLTGLDPAGPAFVDGDVDADPRLYAARLGKDAATFVDVIHSNAGNSPVILNLKNPFEMRLGEYGPNGHLDFYPDGGDLQVGCNPPGAHGLLRIGCSHERAYQYFIDSINDNLDTCLHGWVEGSKVCMGELAEEGWNEDAEYISVDVTDWYRDHMSGAVGGLVYTIRWACKALLNIYTEFVDGSVCRNAWPDCLNVSP